MSSVSRLDRRSNFVSHTKTLTQGGLPPESVESFSYDWRRVWDEVEVPHYEGGSRVVGKKLRSSLRRKNTPQGFPLFQTKYEVTRICTEVLSKKIELLFGISSKIDYLCTQKVSIWQNLYPILHPNRLSHTVQILMPT